MSTIINDTILVQLQIIQRLVNQVQDNDMARQDLQESEADEEAFDRLDYHVETTNDLLEHEIGILKQMLLKMPAI